MTYTIKSLFKKLFFLIVILFIISCQDSGCIQADDFGEYDIDTIEVLSKFEQCTWTDYSFEIQGTGHGDIIIAECLKQGSKTNIRSDNFIINSVANNGCLAFLDAKAGGNLNAYQESNTKPEGLPHITCASGTNCITDYLNSQNPTEATRNVIFLNKIQHILSNAYVICKEACVNACKEESAGINLFEPEWQPNNIPSETGGSFGINIEAGRKISITSKGKISLKESTEQNITINVNNNTFNTNINIDVKRDEPLVFDLGGQWCKCTSESTNCTLTNNCGTGILIGENFQGTYDATRENIQARKEFLRRGIIYLEPLPIGYTTDTFGTSIGVPLEFDTKAWQCKYNIPFDPTRDNLHHVFECDTDYSRTGYFINLGKDSNNPDVVTANNLYRIEDTASKNIGGYVIPTANLSNIVNPFSNVYCATTSNNNRKCTIGSNTDTGVDFENNNNGLIIGTQNISNTSLNVNINQAAKLAFKILGDTPNSLDTSSRVCLVNISLGGQRIVENFPISSNDGWKMLTEGSQDMIINEFGISVSSDSMNERMFTIEINNDNNTNSNINCAQGFAVRIFRLNEIKVNNSGFVSFKILDHNQANISSCNIKFDVINPSINLNDGFYENNISNTFRVENNEWTNKIFVRKGQILRFDSSSWETINVNTNSIEPQLWGQTGLSKQCGIGMMLQIEKRPALLCKGLATEEFVDSNCVPILSNTGTIIGCKGFPANICIEQNNACTLGCIEIAGNKYGPNCSEDFFQHTAEDKYLTTDGNEYNITKDTCNQCKIDVENYESQTPSVVELELPQCYNLEDYKGRTTDINEISNHIQQYGNIKEYGLLTTQNYTLGARKIETNFHTYNFSSLEEFTLNPAFRMTTARDDATDYYYNKVSATVVPFNARLKFLVLNNSDFNITNMNKASLNKGSYKIRISPDISLEKGQQLGVVLAHKNWNGDTNNPAGHFMKWVVKYDNDNNLSEDTPYYFNNEGDLIKSEYNTKFFEVADFLSSQDSSTDFRLFFKILDNETDVPFGEYKYENNSGKYMIHMRSEKINVILSTTLLRLIIQPFLDELDGKTVHISKDKYCDMSHISSNNPNYTECYRKIHEVTERCTAGNDCYQVCDKEKLCAKINQDIYVDMGDPCKIVNNKIDKTCINKQTGNLCNNINDCITVGGNKTCPNCFKQCNNKPVNCEYNSTLNKMLSNTKLCTQNLECYTKSADKCITNTDSNDCYISCNKLDLGQKHNCVFINNEKGLLTKLYLGLISNSVYKNLVRLLLTLMLTFYGLGYLLGLTSFTQSELLTRLLKIGFIYLLIGEDGWNIYNATFVRFFKAGVDYLVFSVAGAFNSENNMIALYIRDGNFYDKSILFAGIERNLFLIFSRPVLAKIFGLTFVSLFGILYVVLIVYSLFTYIFAVANAILLYLTAQIFISVLLAIGPIFFIFLLFEKTKNMFENWLKNLMSFALQQIFLLTVFSFFNIIIYDMIKFILSYSVCWAPIIVIKTPPFGHIELLRFWKIGGYYAGHPQVDGANFPGLFHIVIIYLIAKIMKEFIAFIPGLATIKDTMSAKDLSDGMTRGAKGLYTMKIPFIKGSLEDGVKKFKQGVTNTAKRAIFIKSDDDIKKIKEEKAKLRNADIIAENYANKAVRLAKFKNPSMTKNEVDALHKEKRSESFKRQDVDESEASGLNLKNYTIYDGLGGIATKWVANATNLRQLKFARHRKGATKDEVEAIKKDFKSPEEVEKVRKARQGMKHRRGYGIRDAVSKIPILKNIFLIGKTPHADADLRRTQAEKQLSEESKKGWRNYIPGVRGTKKIDQEIQKKENEEKNI
jgi:type IV secretory pathway VirB6-like protein